MVEAVREPPLPGGRRRHGDAGRRSPLPGLVAALRWASVLVVLVLLGWGLMSEARTSYLQSRLLSRWTADMNFEVRPAPSDAIRFPRWGPYDERLGYARLPSFIASLTTRHFGIARQARWSPALERFVDDGGYAIYDEKTRAGLQLFDRDQNVLYRSSYPLLAYRDFASIPSLVVDSVLSIEEHRLLGRENLRRNPAVDWSRFMRAAAGQVAGIVDHRFREGGASTLATQIEKFRHSAGGRTTGLGEKFRQMLTASARAYRDGPDTSRAREEIVAHYLNSTPLGSRAGH